MIVQNGKILAQVRKISLICLFLSIPISLFGAILNVSLLVITGILLLLIYILISIFIWKCPKCKHRLPMRFNINDDNYINDKDSSYICPNCNERIY